VNINSLRYKYDEIKDILLDKVVDCLIISETKLDSSFKDSIKMFMWLVKISLAIDGGL
jgi:exonuclease III